MKTTIVSANSPDAIQHALDVLNNGGLVAFPTDTVYGVGALVFDGKAIESIYVAKNRPIEKAIPVLIADVEDMDKVGMDIPDIARRIATRFFPGPLTCIIPKQPTLPQPSLPPPPSACACQTMTLRARCFARRDRWQSPPQTFQGNRVHPLRRKCSRNSTDASN